MRQVLMSAACLAAAATAYADPAPVFYMNLDDNVQIQGNDAYSSVNYELYGNAQYSSVLPPVLKSGKSVYLPQVGSDDAIGPAGLNAATSEADRRTFFDSLNALPNIGTSLTGSWTMEAWVKSSSTEWPLPDSSNEGTVINLSRKAGDTWLGEEDPYLWGYGSRSNSITASGISNNTTPHPQGYFQGRAYLGNRTDPNYWYPSEGTYEEINSAGVPAATISDWKHVALVFDATAHTLQMYVNGQPSGDAVAVTNDNLFTTFSQTDGLFPIIGADKYNAPASGSDTLWHAFQGYIDQPVLWDGVVTPQQAQSGFQGAIGAARIAGDANFDGVVNLSDLSIMAGKWESDVPYGIADADFNIDGIVNLSDLSIMAGNWGFGTASTMSFTDALRITGLSQAVPEPSTLAAISLGSLIVLRQRPRRRRA